MTRPSLLVIAAVLAARAAIASQIDVTRYDVQLSVAELSRAPLAAEVRIDLEAQQAIEEVELHIEPEKIAVDAVRDGEGRALTYSISPGTPNAHGLTNSTLVIELSSSAAAGSEIRLEIVYRITVQPEEDQRGFFFDPDHHGSAILTTRSWPYYARYWLPSNDHPSDPAAFRFTLTVPPGVVAAANGALVSSSQTLFVWDESRPIPTYAAHVTIGELAAEIGEVDAGAARLPFHFYFPPSLPNRPEYAAEITRATDALAYFSTVLGPYAFAKAGFVVEPHPFSMEHASLVTLTTPEAAVHEIVHHWWGNAVQIETWGDFWLSEGLTTYFTGFYDEVTRGVNTACMITTRTLSVAPDQDPMDLYTLDPYCIGAAAIDDYRRWLAGTLGLDVRDPAAVEVFLAVFRRVYEALAFRPAGTRDFVDALSRASHRTLHDAGADVTRFAVTAATEEWLSRWFRDAEPRNVARRRAAGR